MFKSSIERIKYKTEFKKEDVKRSPPFLNEVNIKPSNNNNAKVPDPRKNQRILIVDHLIDIFKNISDTSSISNSKYNTGDIVTEIVDGLTEYKYVLTNDINTS